MLPIIPNLDDSKGLSVPLEVRQGLEQHVERRSRGISTISVAVGDGAGACRLWLELERTRILVAIIRDVAERPDRSLWDWREHLAVFGARVRMKT